MPRPIPDDYASDDQFVRRFFFTRDIAIVFVQFLIIGLCAVLLTWIASILEHWGLVVPGSFVWYTFQIAASVLLGLDMILFLYAMVRASIRALGRLK